MHGAEAIGVDAETAVWSCEFKFKSLLRKRTSFHYEVQSEAEERVYDLKTSTETDCVLCGVRTEARVFQRLT